MYDESCFPGINCLNELKVSISVLVSARLVLYLVSIR